MWPYVVLDYEQGNEGTFSLQAELIAFGLRLRDYAKQKNLKKIRFYFKIILLLPCSHLVSALLACTNIAANT